MHGLRHAELRPVDSWFFRDERPFNAGEAGQGHAQSLFPPHLPSVVGVLRASLARTGGWSGRGRWDERLTSVLGDGYEDMGTFRLHEATVLYQGQPLYHVPLHLLGRPQEEELHPHTLLHPSEHKITCDLGEVHLPTPREPARGMKPFEDHWITSTGLGQLLAGDLPDDEHIHSRANLWHREDRIGLARDPEHRSAREGMLYAPSHVRLARDVGLGVRFGLEEDWALPSMFRFGGEARLATCQTLDEQWSRPTCPEQLIRERGRAAIVLVSPTRFDSGLEIPEEFEPGLELVSACVGKPIWIGGWNSLERRPKPLTPYLPAGSVLFVKNRDEEAMKKLLALHDGHLGQKREQGFGHVFVGTW